jgi:hypothetical protein
MISAEEAQKSRALVIGGSGHIFIRSTVAACIFGTQ